MPQQEKTGKRNLDYSKWHRYPTLPSWCYMIDIDSVEWRNNRGVVALIETATAYAIAYNKKFQLMILKEMASKLHIPCYLVLYHLGEESTRHLFEVYDLTNTPPKEPLKDAPKKYMNEEKYKEFIQKL